jgi:membrane protein insertase Oxa1/YidC/SpoIIIJ
MWQDLAALTPPLVMCAAVIIGVVFFLRHQMGPRRHRTDTDRRPPHEPPS